MIFFHNLDELRIEEEYYRKSKNENEKDSKTEDGRVFLHDIFLESIDLLREDDRIRVGLSFGTFEKECRFFVLAQRDGVPKLHLSLSESIGEILDDLIFLAYSLLCCLIKSDIVRSLSIEYC